MNLDEILKPYECTSEHDCTHKEELARTKQAIETLISTQVASAVKAKLQKILEDREYAFYSSMSFEQQIMNEIETLNGVTK